MEIEDEPDADGTVVILIEGDNLKKVPKSHRHLLDPAILEWWPDPVAAMHSIAERAVSRSMREWFRQLADEGTWVLNLHSAYEGKYEKAGFEFCGPIGVRGAEIRPPQKGLKFDHLPKALAQHNQLVGQVDWMGFGTAGQLDGGAKYNRLNQVLYGVEWDDIKGDESFALASGPGGDVLFFTNDDRSGWAAHDCSKTQILGTVAETIEWIYAELLANRCPDITY